MMNINTTSRFIQFLKRKSKGWAFLLAIVMLIVVLILAMLLYQKERAHIIKDQIEDTLTSSALGSMIVDYYAYGIDKDLKFLNQNSDATYNNLCNLIAKNLKLERNGTYLSSARSKNALLNTSKYPACIERVITYEKVKNQIIQTEYNSVQKVEETNPISKKKSLLSTTPYGEYKKTITNTNEPSVKTPNNKNADTLGVYVEIKYPVTIAGKEQYLRGGIFVNIRQIN